MTVKTYFRIILSLFLLVAGVILYTHFTGTINAQTEEVEQLTDEVTTQTEETLEETAEKSIEQVKKYLDPGRVQGVLQEMFSSHYGMVGEVQRINDDALTIQNMQGTTILAINDEEVEITKGGSTLDLTDIAVGNWVTILGYREAEDFTPKFIRVSESSLRPATQLVLIGMITEVSSQEVTVLDRATQEERTFSLTRSTDVEDFSGDAVSISTFEEDYNVLIVASTTDEEEDFEVLTIRSLAPLDELN